MGSVDPQKEMCALSFTMTIGFPAADLSIPCHPWKQISAVP